jgi:hypothetical protein
MTEAELLEEDEQPLNDQLDGAVSSVAEAYPAEEEEDQIEDEPAYAAPAPPQAANDAPVEDVPAPEAPTRFVPSDNKKTPVQHDEEDEEELENVAPVRSRNHPPAGATYFPVTFGSTNGGAIAIANSYSTGKGEKNLKICIQEGKNFFCSLIEEVPHQAEPLPTAQPPSPKDDQLNNKQIIAHTVFLH